MSSDSNKRPIQPPCYSAALQRKFMLQHDITPDVGLSQKEASTRAKIMYEESLQKYLQERYDRKHYGSGALRRMMSRGQPRPLAVTSTPQALTSCLRHILPRQQTLVAAAVAVVREILRKMST
ncbi:hypothetical protein C0Q70_11386 [Pomacea canaliculata]|uniref:Uncharacterized protein n=1 Tax=Pomacea canaliculata TaxID=400727 RepID=A0A2T7P5V8_POMCA|nr:hypothetical protein C0Q70_11386 [Pomacea canaliculata]